MHGAAFAHGAHGQQGGHGKELGIRVTGPMLQREARSIARTLGISERTLRYRLASMRGAGMLAAGGAA